MHRSSLPFALLPIVIPALLASAACTVSSGAPQEAAAAGCSDGARTRPVGETWETPACPGRPDIVNSCTCKGDGRIECSVPTIECGNASDSPPPVHCEVDGKRYAAGDTWQTHRCLPRMDIVDTCECRPDGSVTCIVPTILCAEDGETTYTDGSAGEGDAVAVP